MKLRFLSKVCAAVVLNLYSLGPLASPWLPEVGQYTYITNFNFVDSVTIQRLKVESRTYYAFEQDILFLYGRRYEYENDDKLTPEAKAHRVQKVDEQILNTRRKQANVRKDYPLRFISQSVEYGICENHSLALKVISQMQNKFIHSSRENLGFELSHKTKLFETNKYIISLQPMFAAYKNSSSIDDVSGSLALLVGRTEKTKFGKTLNLASLAPGLSKDSWYFNIDYTTGLETKNGALILLQTYNRFRPKASKLYNQTSTEQFSLAKSLYLGSSANPVKATVQIGYFNELSIRAQRSLASGVQFAIWLQL
ncbi:MAG: hypothetical protein V4485_01105 [Pseudomonadota bacterium]